MHLSTHENDIKCLSSAYVIVIGHNPLLYYMRSKMSFMLFGGVLLNRTPSTFLNLDGFSQSTFCVEQSKPFKMFDPSI
jgi:hypothetical protein